MYEYSAYCANVTDGDTMDLDVDLGFGMKFAERFRLLGVNTPETWRRKKDSDEYKAGMVAKQFVKDLCLHRNIKIRTHKDKKGKYGRYLFDVLGYDFDLADRLIAEGLAEPFMVRGLKKNKRVFERDAKIMRETITYLREQNEKVDDASLTFHEKMLMNQCNMVLTMVDRLLEERNL